MAREFNINELAAAAKRGEPEAQYRLAAVLSGEGEKEAAVAMLKKAAGAGHLDARFTLANFLLTGHLMPKNIAHAGQILEQSAAKGHEASMRLFAVMQAMGHGADANWPAAMSLVIEGARAGSPWALTDLALLRGLYGFDDTLSDALMLAAATRDNIIAAMHLVRRHIEGADSIDASLAKQWTARAQRMGHPLAPDFAAALAGAAPIEQEPTAIEPSPLPPIPDSVHADLATSPEALALPACSIVLDRPHVETVGRLISRQLCDHIIAQSGPLLRAAQVVDPTSGELRPDPYRHSYNMTFWPADLDLALFAVGARMCAVAGLPSAHGEMLSVLFYQPGMYYGPHFDCLVPDAEGQNEELARSGQRPKTVLIYLNDGYEGGETNFVRAGLSHKGQAGDAIIFENVLADGEIDEQSLHESTPVTGGVKWIASKWMREKPYIF